MRARKPIDAGLPLAGSILLFVTAAGWAQAQNLDALVPQPVPPQVAPLAPVPSATPAGATGEYRIGTLEGETVLLPRLLGAAFYDSADAAQRGTPGPGPAVHGLPLLETPEFRAILHFFLDAPASREGLDRVATAARLYLSQIGYPFSLVYLPPQDITTGIVRYVVTVSRLEETAAVTGARYFAPALYQAGLRAQPGQSLNRSQLDADLAWINRNPFRAARATAVAGAEPGTSRILVQVKERLPWRFFAGADNTGTATTQIERLNAGINWGNAWGLGHQLTAQWSSSWDFETTRSGSGSYVIDLPWRHTLSFNGAYSRTNGLVAPPFALEGASWQIGAGYDVPLASTRAGFSHALQLGVDFKSSDNNFTFADIPISDNLTHVVQARATWSGRLAWSRGVTAFGATLAAAPGGLTSRNEDRFFNLSRSGARAAYLYFRGSASHALQLKPGLPWSIRGQLQLASHNLIGSEQFGGGGANTVRGYEEGEVYKDNGALLSHELRLPPWSPRLGRDRFPDTFQLFLFQDYARLWSTNKLPGESGVDLHSAGVGLDYSLGHHATVRAAYGWQFIDSGSSDTGDNARLHLAASLGF